MDKAKKIYNKMKKDGMLPDHFHGTWEKDKNRFSKQVQLDESVGISYEEIENYNDDDEDYD